MTIYDAIVVGAGAGGGVAAGLLAEAGKRVLLIERGRDLAYGDIPFYPAIFSGSQGKGKITVGWSVDGGVSQLLTVFRHDGFQEELWQYVPGSGFSLISTATWSLASSCPTADFPRPRQFQ